MAKKQMTIIKDEGQAIMLVFGIVLLVVLGFFVVGGVILFSGLPNSNRDNSAARPTPTEETQPVSGGLDSGSATLKTFKSGDCKFDIAYSSAFFKAQTVAKGSYRNLLGNQSSGVRIIAEKYNDSTQGELLIECLDYPSDRQYTNNEMATIMEDALDARNLKYTAKTLNSFALIGGKSSKQMMITFSAGTMKPQQETIYFVAEDNTRVGYAIRVINPSDELYKKPFNELLESLALGVR